MVKRYVSPEQELNMRSELQDVQEAFPSNMKGFLLFDQTCINVLII